MEKYGFVYIWFDRKHERYYVGCRWGREDDGYICSSSWMKKAYRYRPDDFRRRILKTNINTKQQTLEEEYRWLSKIKDEELGIRYYNLSKRHFGHWAATDNHLTIREKMSAKWTSERKEKHRRLHVGKIVSEESKEKNRQKHLGKKLTKEHIEKIVSKNKGKKRSVEFCLNNSLRQKGKKRGSPSEETRKKMSEIMKGRKMSPESIEKTRQANLGRKFSDETRRKMSEAHKGIKFSDETRRKMSEAHKGINKD